MKTEKEYEQLADELLQLSFTSDTALADAVAVLKEKFRAEYERGMREAASLCLVDVERLRLDATRMAEENDGMNAYLYRTQAMAHNLDSLRILSALTTKTKDTK